MGLVPRHPQELVASLRGSSDNQSSRVIFKWMSVVDKTQPWAVANTCSIFLRDWLEDGTALLVAVHSDGEFLSPIAGSNSDNCAAKKIDLA